jgi:predicted nucleic acid-binding protein
VPGLFLDSSAVVKLVADEEESNALRMYLGELRRTVLISELAIVEVTRAARRLEADASAVLDECDVVLLDAAILHAAAALDPTTLRTLDAINLATALSVEEKLDAFVAYDDRLLAAARHHGLAVAAPGGRPR